MREKSPFTQVVQRGFFISTNNIKVIKSITISTDKFAFVGAGQRLTCCPALLGNEPIKQPCLKHYQDQCDCFFQFPVLLIDNTRCFQRPRLHKETVLRFGLLSKREKNMFNAGGEELYRSSNI